MQDAKTGSARGHRSKRGNMTAHSPCSMRTAQAQPAAQAAASTRWSPCSQREHDRAFAVQHAHRASTGCSEHARLAPCSLMCSACARSQIQRARTVQPTCALSPRGRRTLQPNCDLNPRGRRGRHHARQRASPTCALRPRGQRTLQPTALSPRGRRGRRHARQRASPGAVHRAAPVPGAARPPACAVRHRRVCLGRAEGFLSDGQNPGNFFFSGDFW